MSRPTAPLLSQEVEYRLRSVSPAEGAPEPVFLSFQNLDPRGHLVRGILIGAGIGLGLGIGAGVVIGGFTGGVIGGMITVLGAIGGAIGGLIDWLGDLFD